MMQQSLRAVWNEEDGVLSFEWVMLLTLLTIGIVSGITAARDGIVDELGDTAEAMLALDGSFTIDFPLQVSIDPDGPGPQPSAVAAQASNSQFIDGQTFTDCDRDITFAGQTPIVSNDGANE